MGTDDAAVTHPNGRVRDLDGLRVVDTSLMPQVTNANFNAPTMMMAESNADIIRRRALLPPETAPVAGPILGASGDT